MRAARSISFLLLFGLLALASVTQAEELPEWSLCQNDDDCVIVDDCGCGGVAVNKNHKSEAEREYAHACSTGKCMPRNPPIAVKCLPHPLPCKDALGRIDPATNCMGMACTPLTNQDVCRRAEADMLAPFRLAENHCRADSDCDAFQYDICEPPLVLPKENIKAALASDRYRYLKKIIHKECAVVWNKRPACEPFPLIIRCLQDIAMCTNAAITGTD